MTTIILNSRQAITTAPPEYDYGWMMTLVDNIAVDERGRACRLVENEDDWHFAQQLLRYQSGLHLAIADQQWLDDFLSFGWLKPTPERAVRIHRIKIDLRRAIDWEDGRRDALLECLERWRDASDVKYTPGHRLDYYLECRGDVAAQQVQAKLRELGLEWQGWGPQLDIVASDQG